MKKYDKKHIIFFIIGIFVFFAGGVYYFLKNNSSNIVFESVNNIEPEENHENLLTEEINTDFSENLSENLELENQNMTVYITGAIKNPDVYIIENGKRINDLVKLSGGLTENADTLKTNLAEEIFDGQHVHIYEIDEEPISQPVKTNIETTNQEVNLGLVNINTASSVELSTIPGIGEIIAQNIIEYRESSGKFKSVDDIKNVNRIGKKTFENIKNYITVN